MGDLLDFVKSRSNEEILEADDMLSETEKHIDHQMRDNHEIIQRMSNNQ